VGLAGAGGTGVTWVCLGILKRQLHRVKTAASGDAACLGPWGQLGRVLGPAAEAVVVLCVMVLCVVCCGTCGRLWWLAVVGWGSV
jgi:hypothetical protein